MQNGGYGKSQYGGYARKRRVKPRFYVIVALLLGASVWGLIALTGLFRPARVEWGRLTSSQPISAIVMRDESVVTADEYAKIACIATEGAAVKTGDALAMMYLSGFSETDISKLANMRNQIKDYQENSLIKDTIDKDLALLNGKIDAKMKEISEKVIARQTQDLAVSEQDLRTLMDQRKEYMKTSVMADDELNRMYQLEAGLEEKVNRTRKVLPSPAEGLISFYLDGYEGTLTAASIDKMTPKTIRALMDEILKNRKSYKSDETVLKDQPICRIVNPASWYALIVMNKSANPLIEGTDHEVTFDGLQKAVNAHVLKVIEEGRYSLIVLQVPEGVQAMLSLRLVNGHLGQDIEGFRVPANMLVEENGKAYIGIQGAGAKVQRIEVNLLGRDERYAVVSEAAGEGVLAAGLPLAKP